MCLYTSKKKGIILKKDLICYKQLEKQEDGTWKTPIMYWIIPKLDTMITPDKDAPEISNFGYKYRLGGGVIHAYLQNPINDNSVDGKLYRAIIPAGTEFWISDDLCEVAAKKMYITSEEVLSLEDATLDTSSILSHPGADIMLTGGKRVPLSSEISPEDVVGIYSGDKVILRDVNLDGIQFSDKPIPGVWRIALKDMDGEGNCKLLPPDLPILKEARKQGGYIPALDELQEAFKNLLEVNISRVTLGLPIIPNNNWFWTSTPRNSVDIWCCDNWFNNMGFCTDCYLRDGYAIYFLKS